MEKAHANHEAKTANHSFVLTLVVCPTFTQNQTGDSASDWKFIVQSHLQLYGHEDIPEVQQECQRIIDKFEGKHVALEGLTREQFYECARKAYAIVYTSEPHGYACLLLKKGVKQHWKLWR